MPTCFTYPIRPFCLHNSMGFITTNYIGGGLLTERYGSKWVFGLAVFGSSALGFVLPIMASLGSGALLAVRIVQGVLQGGPTGSNIEIFMANIINT